MSTIPQPELPLDIGELTTADPRDLSDRQITKLRDWFNSHLYYFCEHIMGFHDLKPELHGPICTLIQEWGQPDLKRLLIQIPREMFKTSVCTRANALWQVCRGYYSGVDDSVVIFNERLDNCVAPDTRIPTLRGVVRAEELLVGDETQSLDDELRLTTNKVTAISPSTSPAFVLTFRSGLKITVTPNHPMMTPSGWVPASRLQIGSPVVAARRLWLPVKPVGQFPYTAGALTGDGSFGRSWYNGNPTTPILGCWDREIIDSCHAEGADVRGTSRHGYWSVRASTWKSFPTGMWARDRDKHVPSEYEGSAEFLSGLFDTDGTVSFKPNRGQAGSISFSSVSERLARDVQRNLLYFGVASRLRYADRRKPSREPTHIWTVEITGQQNAELFEKHVGFRIYRKASRTRALAERQSRSSSRLDQVPTSWMSTLAKGDIGRLWRKRLYVHRTSWASRERTLAVARELSRPDIARLASPDIRWDEVSSVEHVDRSPITRISVDGNHSYIGNGLLNHNSSKWIRSVRDVVGGSQLFHILYADMLPPGISFLDTRSKPHWWKWSDTELMFQRTALGIPEASITGIGLEAAATGGHWPTMIIDDPISLKHAQSAAEMERAREWVDKHVYLMRPIEEGRSLVVDTPWAYSDINVDFIDRYDYKVYRRSGLEKDGYPDLDGESIFPEKLSTKKMQEMYERDDFGFMSQVMCRPSPGREKAVDLQWLRNGTVLALDTDNPLFIIDRNHYDPNISAVELEEDFQPPRYVPLSAMNKMLFWDPAPSKATERKREPRARNGLVMTGKDPWGRIYLLEVQAIRSEPVATMETAFALLEKWGCNTIGIEEVVFSALYAPFMQYMERVDKRFRGRDVHFTRMLPGKEDKDTRIQGEFPLIKQGFYYLNTPLCGPWRAEILEYPYGSTVDCIDATSYERRYLQRPESSFELQLLASQDQERGRQSDPVTGYSVVMESDIG